METKYEATSSDAESMTPKQNLKASKYARLQVCEVEFLFRLDEQLDHTLKNLYPRHTH